MLGSAPTEIVRTLTRQGATLATAESLTGGLVAAALTSVPGASAVFRGGVVAYATDLKAALLAVPKAVLDRDGAPSAATAAAMAEGVRELCGATYGVATTGVAGPDWQDGAPPGTIHVAVVGPTGLHTDSLVGVAGDREDIRQQAVKQAVGLLSNAIREDRESRPGSGR